MPTLRERVPPRLRTPLSISSIVTGLVGIAIGYILTLTGIVLYFGLHPIASKVTTTDTLIVIGVGLAASAIGLVGLRGFLYFAY